MQGGIFSYALLAILATGLLVAAYTDLQRRQIDNRLTGAIALAAPVFWYAAGLSFTEIGYQLGLALAVFIVTAILFALRQMGGGDVKLLAALALWIAPLAFIKLLVIMALIGGAASVGGAAFNVQRREGESARDVIGAAGSILFVGLSGWVIYGILASQPLLSAELLGVISQYIPQPWIVIAALLILAGIIFFGVLHVVKRQKARLRIPYGVAISIAGLWVLANTYLPVFQHNGSIG